MSERTSKPATIATVAAQAGVSTASVSRVLNGDPSVGSDIRNKVEAAVAEMDYKPNAAARSLRAQDTRQVALVVDDIANPAYLDIVAAVQEVVREDGRRLLLLSSNGRDDEERAILDSLGQRFVDGLVMTSTRFSPSVVAALRQAPVPVVVIGSSSDLPVDRVAVDAGAGVRTAVAHLADQGCHHLAMVNGPAHTLPAQSRLNGFLGGAADAHVSVAVVLHGDDWDRESGRRAGLDMLDRANPPDAVLCANDQLALGVLDACYEQQVAVPDDLAVVGVDNSRDANVCRPRLTSLDLSFSERGRIAARLLLDRISGQVVGDAQDIQVETTLVTRASSQRGGAA